MGPWSHCPGTRRTASLRMPSAAGRRLARLAALIVALAGSLSGMPANAGDVELAPFIGLQYGGGYVSTSGVPHSFDESLDYGATLDLALAPTWRLELLYSRQETKLEPPAGAPTFPQVVERYMVGIQEEPETDGPFRFFGVALLGATRLVPGLAGVDSELRFAVGLSLGTKVPASSRFGLRLEARGFYTVVDSGGAVFCTNGTCLFRFSGSGIWQGDVTAGVILRF
jgi:hypothetical protein